MTKSKLSVLLLLAMAFISCKAGETNESAVQPTPETTSRPSSFSSDDAMLDYIEKVHLNYMWDGADPTSGLAYERIHLDNQYPENDQDVVTLGGSGFGVAGLLVGIDRGFINRADGVARLTKIVNYLSKADRFHGMWPHWLYGPTGKVKPFGQKDDGGDLVESSFMMQSLLCVRQYFRGGNTAEKQLADKIDTLWQGMEYDWYRNGGKNVIYWHWSPDYGWDMNFPLQGYNECLIAYILGASSPTHSIPAACYHEGWARSGAIKSNSAPFGYALELKHNGAEELGGPLFWSQYSYIGLCPKGLTDEYADYWNVTRNHAMSDYEYCVRNPKGYKGYGKNCWGLTASYSIDGYSAHSPGNDLGVITPTAALSSFPYTPQQSMAALKYFWGKGNWIWGKYGFYDAFSETANWTAPHYLAIDQLTIAPMIENYRTGLLWNLFMSCPEIQSGLKKLGFTINN
ncbi:glucoamylase family protein [Xylanibacter oryzae]|uniref:glucoamylase family protein n=1 Tax=Xylanibacter oryzae TaxID=185293 RepID=UPI0004B30A3A|nr:glucoamylase family protein [Xylanibacter oryzae]